MMDSPGLMSDSDIHPSGSAARIRAKLHGEIRDDTIAIVREEVQQWANPEHEAIRHDCTLA